MMIKMSDKIIRCFERLGRTVKSLTIDNIVNNPCRYCGYGKTYSGAVLVSGEKDHHEISDEYGSSEENDESISDDMGPDRTISFVYRSGCLSEDETMTFN